MFSRIFSFIAIFVSIINTDAYNLNFMKVDKKMYNRKVIKVYEPNTLKSVEMDSIVFFTGGNSIIPGDIYSTFIGYLVDYNYSVSVVSNNIDSTCSYLRDIKNKYNNFYFLSHSSGATNAIEVSNRFMDVEKAIFLDPVDNTKLIKMGKNEIYGLRDLLIITADKSYEWSVMPFKVPFIPAFRLDTKDIGKKNPDVNIKYVNAYDNGHTDVLDSLWSDLMHSTFSKGTEDRSEQNLNRYRKFLVDEIHKFICDDATDVSDVSDGNGFLYEM